MLRHVTASSCEPSRGTHLTETGQLLHVWTKSFVGGVHLCKKSMHYKLLQYACEHPSMHISVHVMPRRTFSNGTYFRSHMHFELIAAHVCFAFATQYLFPNSTYTHACLLCRRLPACTAHDCNMSAIGQLRLVHVFLLLTC